MVKAKRKRRTSWPDDIRTMAKSRDPNWTEAKVKEFTNLKKMKNEFEQF